MKVKAPKKVNPAAAVPQAPRVLRVGSKGHARAAAAAAAGKPSPDEEDDDDDPDDEEDDDDAKALAAHDGLRSAASAALEKAAATYKAGLGSDSAAGLRAEEADSAAARGACEAAESSSMGLRGAAADDAPPDSKRPGAMPPPGAAAPSARAIARVAGGSAPATLEVTQLVALARFAMVQLGEPDITKARGTLAAKLQLAARAEQATAGERDARTESAAVQRERMWEQAVTDGRFRTGQVFAQAEGPVVEGKPTRVRVFSAYATSMNAAHPDNAGLEAFLAAFPKLVDRNDATASSVLSAAGEKASGARQLTDADRASAQRAGLDPALLAAALAAKGATHDDHQRA